MQRQIIHISILWKMIHILHTEQPNMSNRVPLSLYELLTKPQPYSLVTTWPPTRGGLCPLKTINVLFRRIKKGCTRYVHMCEHITTGFDHIRSTFSSKAVQSSAAALRSTLFTLAEIVLPVNDSAIGLQMWNIYSMLHWFYLTIISTMHKGQTFISGAFGKEHVHCLLFPGKRIKKLFLGQIGTA